MFPPAIDHQLLFTRANDIYLHPTPLYDWVDIVRGVRVAKPGGGYKTYVAVDRDTIRGFYRIDQTLPGALDVFKAFFAQTRHLLPQLMAITSWQDLHNWENALCAAMRGQLTNIIKPAQLVSYNKVRKPVDLCIVALVAMAEQTTPIRTTLTPHLFLPLDSQMFANPNVFTDQELADHGLKRKSTYTDVRDEPTYLALQEILRQKAANVANTYTVTFSRIYFDMFWNNRYLNWGSNLFETNP